MGISVVAPLSHTWLNKLCKWVKTGGKYADVREVWEQHKNSASVDTTPLKSTFSLLLI